MPEHILIADDEPSMTLSLSYILQKENFEVTIANTGKEALELYDRNTPDLILLDLMLPELPGLEVCRQIRAKAETPIIMLTAKSSEIDKIVGLELGADDYVTKPFASRELIARIRSVLRRYRHSNSKNSDTSDNSVEDTVITANGITIDIRKHMVTVRGEEIALPLKEFALLEILMKNQGYTVTRSHLIDHVWGTDYFGDTKTLDVHVKRLRSRIEQVPSVPRILVTVRGVGYRFTDD